MHHLLAPLFHCLNVNLLTKYLATALFTESRYFVLPLFTCQLTVSIAAWSGLRKTSHLKCIRRTKLVPRFPNSVALLSFAGSVCSRQKRAHFLLSTLCKSDGIATMDVYACNVEFKVKVLRCLNELFYQTEPTLRSSKTNNITPILRTVLAEYS